MDFKYICEGYPWMDPSVWSGRTSPLLPFEPADYEVTARGSSFHMIIGNHSHGKYLCIPDWGSGWICQKMETDSGTWSICWRDIPESIQ